ncbi:hypothetical protein HYR99_27300 [Candidatus Poribacteria bacterium]|nr:hypothetical protein [Candidatus Poribacteria bacterium]
MRKRVSNFIVGFCLLVCLPSIVYSQRADEWYKAGKNAFEGLTGDGGVKRDIKEAEKRLNGMLSAKILQALFKEQEDFLLNDFFSELLIQRLEIPNEVKGNLPLKELSLSAIAVQSFIAAFQIPRKIESLIPNWKGLSSDDFFDQLSEIERKSDIPEVDAFRIAKWREKSHEIIDLMGIYINIGQKLNNNVLSSLNRAIEINPNYTDAYLKKVEVYLTMHLEPEAVDEFEKARALMKQNGLQDMTFPLTKSDTKAPSAEGTYQPTTLRDLVYRIAAIYIQGHLLPPEFTTSKSTDPGNDAAVALINDFVQLKTQDSSLSGDEKEDQETLDRFELVKFYRFVGQPDQARGEYDRVYSELRANLNDLPKYLRDEIERLKAEIPQTTQIFLAFNVEKLSAHIRLAPSGESPNLADYLAVSYQEIGTKVRLAHQIETVADRKRYGFPLKEPGKSICFIDILEISAEAEDKLPIESTFLRGNYPEDIIYNPLKNTEPQFTFTKLGDANPQPITIKSSDFVNELLPPRTFTRGASYRGNLQCALELAAQTSYNFSLKPYMPPRPTWTKIAVVFVLQASAIISAISTF